MEGFLCFLAVAGPIGIFAWQLVETRRAVATTVVDTPLSPNEAARVTQEAFTGPRAVLWTSTAGPGTINMRRRGIHRGITMSITIRPRENGGSEVSMWASETVIYLGALVNFAGVVNRRKNAIGRAMVAAVPA
ncbi:hypothetical protein COUCH_34330 [Couchioplanes caeruleus]|uniref:hypothetical protein n=1 Tax=Couchioplanes caeruleus TaxID=56438 RepID=UPI0020BE68DB|nr:hypothetical protein [Couchioplanes caeruleus]UQU64001.1 hypothetical protein COUCH_34330 [Couchioplanes caeruleus]